MREILLYHRESGRVICDQCAHRCTVRAGERGQCGVLLNKEGVLYSLVADLICATHIDPIERKSFLHVLPGSRSLSVAAMGCNLRCPHCQSHEISHVEPDGMISGRSMSPAEITAHARQSGCRSIVFTYTEPTVYLDLAHDVARLARDSGLLPLFVTNGYMTSESIAMISPHLGAVAVDLKCFSDRRYREMCGGALEPVCRTIERMHAAGVWVEVTTVLVPELCHEKDQLVAIADYLASVDPTIPWQIVPFKPSHQLAHLPPTRSEALEHAVAIGRDAGLRHVYGLGLLGSDGAESTFCPSCGSLVIERFGFEVRWFRIENGCCPDCGARIEGIW